MRTKIRDFPRSFAACQPSSTFLVAVFLDPFSSPDNLIRLPAGETLDGVPELGNCSVFGRCLLTDCLQPQMKTYRCPWCVSRTNHNILYFVNISRTTSLNTAICLWKLRISLVCRGSWRSNLHRIWGTAKASQAPPSLLPTLAPGEPWHKAQDWCSSRAILFKLWTISRLYPPARSSVPRGTLACEELVSIRHRADSQCSRFGPGTDLDNDYTFV
jgi:hypothetical protein